MDFEWLWCVHMGSAVVTKVPTTLARTLIMREVLHVWGQGVYGIDLYFSLNFAMNLKLFKNKVFFWKKKESENIIKSEKNSVIFYNNSRPVVFIRTLRSSLLLFGITSEACWPYSLCVWKRDLLIIMLEQPVETRTALKHLGTFFILFRGHRRGWRQWILMTQPHLQGFCLSQSGCASICFGWVTFLQKTQSEKDFPLP